MQVFLGDEYSYAPASPPQEIDDAFVFPPKEATDEVSESISFSVWGQRLIGIANQDIYFELASICSAEQYWKEQQHGDNNWCPSCPSTQYSKYSFSFGLQPTSCFTCADFEKTPNDVATFLLDTVAPTCTELLEQQKEDERNKPPPPPEPVDPDPEDPNPNPGPGNDDPIPIGPTGPTEVIE